MRPLHKRQAHASIRALLVICGMAALAHSGAQAASWNEFHADENARYAYDSQSRRRTPQPRITALKNFHQPTPQGDLSAKLVYEADCKSARIRLLNGIYSRNQTAEGAVSGMINSNGWAQAQSTPVLEKLYALLCDSPDASATGQRIDTDQ